MVSKVKLTEAQEDALRRALRSDGPWSPYASLFTAARKLNRKKLLAFVGNNEAGRPRYKITPAGRALLSSGKTGE